MEERLPKTATKVNSQGYPPVKCRPIIATESLRKDDGQLETIPRPELELFGLAMLGGGKVTGTAHLYDYPWQDAADGTVVDVGGGIGETTLITLINNIPSPSSCYERLTGSHIYKAVLVSNCQSCIPKCTS